METTILMEHVDISNEIVNEHNKLTIQISQMNIIIIIIIATKWKRFSWNFEFKSALLLF